MSIGGRARLSHVTLDDIVAEARSWSHSARRADAVAVELVERITDALDRGAVPPESQVGAHVRAEVERLRRR